MFESKSGILLIAGLGFFLLAFLANAVVPWAMYRDRPEQTVDELVNRNLLHQFENLADLYPEGFARAFGEPPPRPSVEEVNNVNDAAAQERAAGMRAARDAFLREKCVEALALGRDVYVGEACWHCHSQFVRPVSNEEQRYGPVARSAEYENELQRPVLFGTRRVGPDLSREGGRRGNDWHVVHFFRPRMTSPESVMPEYPWFFDDNTRDGPGQPNKRGFALITYMQWLGSWLDSYPHYNLNRTVN